MSTAPAISRDVRTICIEQDFHIAAPRPQVYRALTGSIGAWWGAPYLRNPARARTVVLETRLGGRLYEDWGDGEGWQWATITGIERNRCIEALGPMGLRGAVASRIRFDLCDTPSGTKLQLTHQALGLFSGRVEEVYRAGWGELLNVRLRAFVEKGERMGLERDWERVATPLPSDRSIL